jgi:DNA-binding Lrp family transcriptional regulator
MMTTIFVMIKCELGRAHEVACDLVDNSHYVPEVFSISGEYDLLARFTLDKEVDAGAFVVRQVQTRPGIRDTHTILTFSPFTPNVPTG